MAVRQQQAVEIRGLDDMKQRFKVIDENIRPELKRATEEVVHGVHQRVPDYPVRFGSHYVRTGNLGRSIHGKVEPLARGFVGKIGSDPAIAPYAPDVISDEPVGDRGPQARIHQGIWWTLQGVVRGARSYILKTYQQAVDRIVSKKGR